MRFLLVSDTHGRLAVIDELADRVRADARGGVVPVQKCDDPDDAGIGHVLHADQQDELDDPALRQFDLLEHDDLRLVVSAAQISSDPKDAGPRHEIEQHLQAVVGFLQRVSLPRGPKKQPVVRRETRYHGTRYFFSSKGGEPLKPFAPSHSRRNSLIWFGL